MGGQGKVKPNYGGCCVNNYQKLDGPALNPELIMEWAM